MSLARNQGAWNNQDEYYILGNIYLNIDDDNSLTIIFSFISDINQQLNSDLV